MASTEMERPSQKQGSISTKQILWKKRFVAIFFQFILLRERLLTSLSCVICFENYRSKNWVRITIVSSKKKSWIAVTITVRCLMAHRMHDHLLTLLSTVRTSLPSPLSPPHCEQVVHVPILSKLVAYYLSLWLYVLLKFILQVFLDFLWFASNKRLSALLFFEL